MINSKHVIIGFMVLSLLILDVALAWKVESVETDNRRLQERIQVLEQENKELRDHVPDSIKKLITAMIWVESRGDNKAYCKREEAAGCLQIRPIMLAEVNRICALTDNGLSYAHDDRWDREMSVAMFHIWRKYHHRGDTLEKIARNWNGGPDGYVDHRTKRYWKKVKKQLKKLG